MPRPYNALVTVDVTRYKIRSVDPEVAIVDGKAGVAWKINGLRPGYEVEIDFRVQGTRKGPFVPGRAAGQRGRYLVAGKSRRIQSNPSDQEKRGVWKYDILLRDEEGAVVHAIDPSIIIRE